MTLHIEWSMLMLKCLPMTTGAIRALQDDPRMVGLLAVGLGVSILGAMGVRWMLAQRESPRRTLERIGRASGLDRASTMLLLRIARASGGDAFDAMAMLISRTAFDHAASRAGGAVPEDSMRRIRQQLFDSGVLPRPVVVRRSDADQRVRGHRVLRASPDQAHTS